MNVTSTAAIARPWWRLIYFNVRRDLEPLLAPECRSGRVRGQLNAAQ
jgi:hypothetical protein